MDIPVIPRSEFLQRQERARAVARDLGLEALLVVGRAFYDRPGHLGYLVNYFPPEPTMVFGDEVRGAGHGVLVLPVSGDPALVTAGRTWRWTTSALPGTWDAPWWLCWKNGA